MKHLYVICAAALLGIAGYAAETPSEFAKVQAELKQRAPEDYAKIEKLAATDLNAALREFRSTAKKHNIKLPRPTMQRNRNFSGGDFPGRGEFPGRGDFPGRGEFPGRGGRGRGGRGGGNPLAQLSADGKIRKAFPEEFDAVSREMIASEEKMQKLAERAGVKYQPNFASQLRKLRIAAPEKMAEIERLAEDDPRAAFRELGELAQAQGIELASPMMRGGRRGGGGRFQREEEAKPEPRQIKNPPLRKLRETFPEEMKKYEELRQEDPAAAKKLLLELAEKLNAGKTGK